MDKLGILRTTFYRWYDRYLEDGFDELEDRVLRREEIWNCIPDKDSGQLLALDIPEFSPRELAAK